MTNIIKHSTQRQCFRCLRVEVLLWRDSGGDDRERESALPEQRRLEPARSDSQSSPKQLANSFIWTASWTRGIVSASRSAIQFTLPNPKVVEPAQVLAKCVTKSYARIGICGCCSCRLTGSVDSYNHCRGSPRVDGIPPPYWQLGKTGC